ncbi:Bax inhibitor-1/YccA family protein [Flavobacterium sp.]|uniref:Bax inhibitor-1/YccA family protein n=1 Tax=Flavobacterium sp. TaxID=239 RepID=UPI004047EB56
MNIQHFTQEQIQVEQANFMSKVYSWMTGALIITGLVAYYVASSPELINLIVGNKILFFGLIIAEIACVGYISARINKITAQTATGLFVGYSVLNGLTLSMIFLIYTASSIATTFFIAAGTFGIMSFYGYYTKRDLTSIGNLAFMALIGLIIASVVNMFLKSEMMYWITTYAGILIFVALIAYDTQKIIDLQQTK